MGIKSLIFSVCRTVASEDANTTATKFVDNLLTDWDIKFDTTTGVYKGVSERAFIVVDTPDTRHRVLFLARLYRQESVLAIAANQQGELITPTGDYICSLGRIRAVSEQTANSRDAYTKLDNGGYYVGDYDKPIIKSDHYIPGTGTLECGDWDSLLPQPIWDKATGNSAGTLCPRATAEELGYGIQSWSKPVDDTRTL